MAEQVGNGLRFQAQSPSACTVDSTKCDAHKANKSVGQVVSQFALLRNVYTSYHGSDSDLQLRLVGPPFFSPSEALARQRLDSADSLGFKNF